MYIVRSFGNYLKKCVFGRKFNYIYIRQNVRKRILNLYTRGPSKKCIHDSHFFIASFSSIDQATLLFRARVSMYSSIWLKSETREGMGVPGARTGNAALVNHD